MTIHALLLTLAPGLQDELPILPTQVREVTVYGGEALVTRAGRAKLTRGVTRLELRGLPAVLRDDSVKVKTSADAAVVGVDVLPSTGGAAPSKAVEELRAARAAKQRERDELNDRIGVMKEVREYLESIRAEAPKVFGQSVLPGSMDPAKWDSGAAFLSKAMGENAVETRKLTDRIAVVSAELADLDARLEQLQAGLTVPTKIVALDVLADAATETDVEVAYLVGSAGWHPAYDLRTTPAVDSATVSMFGVVTQRTGEDWKDVTLTLSTAKPERGAAPPALQPVVLAVGAQPRARGGLARPTPNERKEADKDLAEDERADAFAAAAPAAPPPLERDAQVSKSGLSTQMRVPRPETVPADGRPHRVRVSESKTELRPIHEATPKLATRAFLKAKPKNAAAHPLLAGPTQVFAGNDFVGRMALPDVLTGEEFDLYLGADPGVVVERRREKADREAPGFLSSRVTWTFAYRITAKNVSAVTGPATVEIVEPVPVSRDDRVKVEIEKANPTFLRGEKEDRERESLGFLRWRVTLKPGEERVIDLSYTVSAPEDLAVLGLDR